MPAPIRRLSRPEATRLRSSLVVPTLSRVLSELAQNALDADATRIDCWVNVTGGNTAVRVEDDGTGMDLVDLEELGGMHVSSKASHAWAGSGSYGFRGEALVSIAALAIVEITSRQEGGETYTKVLKNGKTLFLGRSRHDLPRTRGTTVVVRELFNVVPVRQAALVANALPACRRTIETLALVNPQIRWTLREDRTGGAKQLLVVHGGKTSCDVFRSLYGHAGVEQVQSVRVSEGDRRVDGFISLEGSVTKGHQHLYINGYPISSSDLHQVIESRFAQSQFSALASNLTADVTPTKKRPSPRRLERHPVYVLNITLPQQEVDAAYGPGKTTLGYQDPAHVRSFVAAVVDDFLRRQGFMSRPSVTRSRSESPTPRSSGSTATLQLREHNRSGDANRQRRLGSVLEEGESGFLEDTPQQSAQRVEEPSLDPQNGDWVYDLIRDSRPEGVYSTRPDRSLEDDETNTPHDPTRVTSLSTPLSDIDFLSSSLSSPTVLRQVDRKFIPCVLEGRAGDNNHNVLVIFDQHAADERAGVELILEALGDGFANNNMAVTQLQEGHVRLVLTRREAEILERPEARDILTRWGINLTLPDTITGEYIQIGVRGVPALLERLGNKDGTELTRLLKLYLPLLDTDLEEIQAFIATLDDSSDPGWGRIQRWMPHEMVELAKSKACRGAVMFEDKLSRDQCTRLLSRLARTRNPWVCAHGRPTMAPLCILPSTRQSAKRTIDWSAWGKQHSAL